MFQGLQAFGKCSSLGSMQTHVILTLRIPGVLTRHVFSKLPEWFQLDFNKEDGQMGSPAFMDTRINGKETLLQICMQFACTPFKYNSKEKVFISDFIWFASLDLL